MEQSDRINQILKLKWEKHSYIKEFLSQSLTCSGLVFIILVSWHISSLIFDHDRWYLFLKYSVELCTACCDFYY